MLREALSDARLVLLNLHAVTALDAAGWRVIIDASVRAREAGSRLLVTGATPHTDAEAARAGVTREIEFIPRDHARAREATPTGNGDEPHIRPLANPVNARVLAARVMAVPGPDLWLLGTDGAVLRAWAPSAERPSAPGATSVEVYLDGFGAVNGWRSPNTGLAINQRRIDPGDAPPTGSKVPCLGACGVVWLAPAANRLVEHDERCLTCAGPLALA